jgi:hypothetical protein
VLSFRSSHSTRDSLCSHLMVSNLSQMRMPAECMNRAWIIFSGTICIQGIGSPLGILLAVISTSMFGMTVWCYTTACFTDPGCPANSVNQDNTLGYSTLPQHANNPPTFTSVTVKDDGQERYCQKCRCKKPDRTHHCRSCGRCILSMR